MLVRAEFPGFLRILGSWGYHAVGFERPGVRRSESQGLNFPWLRGMEGKTCEELPGKECHDSKVEDHVGPASP